MMIKIKGACCIVDLNVGLKHEALSGHMCRGSETQVRGR